MLLLVMGAVHTTWQCLPTIKLSRLPPRECMMVLWPLSMALQAGLSTQWLCPRVTVVTCVLVGTLLALFLNRVHGPVPLTRLLRLLVMATSFL